MTQNNDEAFVIEVTKGNYIWFTTKEELQTWLKKEYHKEYSIYEIDIILNKPSLFNNNSDLYF